MIPIAVDNDIDAIVDTRSTRVPSISSLTQEGYPLVQTVSKRQLAYRLQPAPVLDLCFAFIIDDVLASCGLICILYPLWKEGICDGVSLGKGVLHLRVVKYETGEPVDINTSCIRNFFFCCPFFLFFTKVKRRIGDFFAKFLIGHQYFDKTVEKKPFLDVFKDTFLFLSDWERNYTPDMEKSKHSLNFRERRNNFRHMTQSFINNIIETFFMFNRADDVIGVYYKYKSQGNQFYNLDSLAVLESFSKEYSLLLIDLIKFDFQGMVSNSLRELLDKTKLLDRLQVLCAKEWYTRSLIFLISIFYASNPANSSYFE